MGVVTNVILIGFVEIWFNANGIDAHIGLKYLLCHSQASLLCQHQMTLSTIITAVIAPRGGMIRKVHVTIIVAEKIMIYNIFAITKEIDICHNLFDWDKHEI